MRNYLGLALIPQAGVAIGLAAMGARTLGGSAGTALETIILSSSVLYELIGPACAKLSLYLSHSYSNRLEDLTPEPEPDETGCPKSEVERLIERINAIQSELPAHRAVYYEDEKAFSDAAEEHYAALYRALAVLLASVIGCERSSKRHSAGLRTFVLVSFASTVSMLLDVYLMSNFGARLPILSAATVIAAALVSGNAILFSSRSQIKGLTTSTGLWACSILGFAIGAGLYTITGIVFLFFLCILACFPAFEQYLKNRSNHFEIHLELKNSGYLRDFVTVSRRLGLRIDDIEANQAYAGSGLSVFTVTFTICSAELKKYKTHREIIEALSSLDYIYHIEEMR